MNKYVYADLERPKSNSEYSKKHRLATSSSEALVKTRPLTATISTYSVLENKRQKLKSIDKSQDPLIRSLKTLKNSSLGSFSMQEKDISAMLVRLDRITRNVMFGQKRAELREGEKITVELLQGESQFAFASTYGRKCPLNILIKRAYGSIETFISRKIKDPTKIINDEISTNDHIRVFDKSFLFASNFCALNFTALKDSSFTVYIKFGNKLGYHKKEVNNVPIPTLDPQIKSFMNEEVVKKAKPEKNFLKMNMTSVVAVKSPINPIKAVKKRNLVKERFKNLQQEVLEKRKNYIKKQELRLDAELKGMEILDVLRRKQNFERFWLTMMHLGNSLVYIRQQIKKIRAKKIERFMETNGARKIQRRFQQILAKNPIQLKISQKFSANLRLFYSITRFTLGFISIKTVNCISEANSNQKLTKSFTKFFQGIILIQTQFREYQVMNQIRLQELEDLWAETLTQRIEKINSFKKKNRKWKKKAIDAYLSITDEVRRKVLADYLAVMKRKFLASWREFKERRRIAQEGSDKYTSTEIQAIGYLCPPIFSYLPEHKEMLDLINTIVEGGGTDESS